MKHINWKFIIFLASAAYIFSSEVLPRFLAYNSVIKNVDLVLQSCKKEDCVITGDWSQDVITLENVLTKQNGEVINFKLEDIKLLKIPTQIE